MKRIQQSDFSEEMAKIIPVILGYFARRHQQAMPKINISVTHIVVIDCLSRYGACKMSELAEAVGFNMSTLTNIIDKMIASGYVKRTRGVQDRRVVRVELLPKGIAVDNQIKANRKQLAEGIFSVLNEREKKEYLAIMTKVYNFIHKNMKWSK